MTRLSARFDKTRAESRAALVTFLMGGDPDAASSLALLQALPEAGADIIEIGLPFSDPMADGQVIQAAGLRALKAQTKVSDILTMVREFRLHDDTTPIVLMGYYNPVYHYGVPAFCADAASAGVDGIILVDLPPEEEAEFRPHARAHGLASIRLIAPTSLETRLPLLLEGAEGFAYYIAVAGITGAKSADLAELKAQVGIVKQRAGVPVAVGFGVKTPEQAKAIGEFADAVVVGSALVEAFHREGQAKAVAFVRKLASALRKQ